jgi:hypothetical protein
MLSDRESEGRAYGTPTNSAAFRVAASGLRSYPTVVATLAARVA